MASITSSVKGFQNFTEICKGTCKGYSYNLVRLYDECDHACCEKAKKSKNRIKLSFKEAENRLRQQIEDTITAIEVERQVQEYCIGRSYVMSRKGISFDPMNHYTWTLEGGLNTTWKNLYAKKEYDGLIAIACIERDIIRKDLRSQNDVLDQEFYSTALTQTLIHNYVIKHPDRRCKNTSCDAGPKWKNKYKAGVVYIAFKCEREEQWYDHEEAVTEATIPPKLQDDASSVNDKEVLMEQIMKLENELSNIRSRTDHASTGSSTSRHFSPDVLSKMGLNQKRVEFIKNDPDDERFGHLPGQTLNLERKVIRSDLDESAIGISKTISSNPYLQTMEPLPADDRGGKQQKTGTKHKLSGETSNTFAKRPKTNLKAKQPKNPTELASPTVVTGKAKGIMTANLAEFQSLVLNSIAAVKQRRSEDNSDRFQLQQALSSNKKNTKKTQNQSRTIPSQGNIQSIIPGRETSGANSQTPVQCVSQPETECFTKKEADLVSKSIRALVAQGLHACTMTNLKEDLTKRLHVVPRDQQHLIQQRIENGHYGTILKEVLKKMQCRE